MTLFLPTNTTPYEKVEVSPVVVFSILDSWLRRPEQPGKGAPSYAVGALIGTFDDNTVSIENCFADVFQEEIGKPTIAIKQDLHEAWEVLMKKLSPNEYVVGWYSTKMSIAAPRISDFYFQRIKRDPILLYVNPSLENGNIDIQTFYCNSLELPGQTKLQSHFLPVPYSFSEGSYDKNTLDLLINQAKSGKEMSVNNLTALESGLQQIVNMLDEVKEYIDEVVSGKVTGNAEIGRQIQHTLATLPTADAGLEKLFNNSVQDLLMAIYLANLTRSHLRLSEKLRDQGNF